MEKPQETQYESDSDRLYLKISSQVQSFLRDIGITEIKDAKSQNLEDMDLCTVYTTTNGGYEIRLVFYAERTLLSRIAEGMMEEPVTDPEDIKDCAKEFFNVVCGHIVAAIFEETKSSARFQCPVFEEGYYLPGEESSEGMVAYCYVSIRSGSAVLLHDPLPMIGEHG